MRECYASANDGVCCIESSKRAKELRKNHLPREDIFSLRFLLKLERCYRRWPLDQHYSRQSILFRSEAVIPLSFTYFFSLPRELRNAIYFHALAPPTPTELIIKPTEPNVPQIWPDEMRIPPGCVFESGESDDWSGREEMTRLLRVNRQVYHGASAVLYSDFRFVVSPVSINTYPTLLQELKARSWSEHTPTSHQSGSTTIGKELFRNSTTLKGVTRCWISGFDM